MKLKLSKLFFVLLISPSSWAGPTPTPTPATGAATGTVWDTKFPMFKDGAVAAGSSLAKTLSEDNLEASMGSNGMTCKRIKDSAEGLASYSKANLPESEISFGNSKIKIVVEGCSDTPFKYTGTSDFSEDSAFPENIVIPVPSNSSLDDPSILSETDMNSEMQAFFKRVREKLAGDYTIDGTKDIIIYTTASTEHATCRGPKNLLQAEVGDPKHMSKSYDNLNQISNTELAFKRSVNLAKVIKKFLLDPFVKDNPNTKLSVRTKCSIKDTKPQMHVYGLLKKNTWPVTEFACGEAINLNGRVGNKAPPTAVDTSRRVRGYSMSKTDPLKIYQIMFPSDNSAMTINPTIENSASLTTKCFGFFKDESGNIISSKTVNSSITVDNKKITVQKWDDCFKVKCLELNKFLLGDLKKMNPVEILQCASGGAVSSEAQALEAPGKYMVASGTNTYTVSLKPTTFKRGARFQLIYDAVYVPDRFIVTLNDKVIIDSGFVSSTAGDKNQFTKQLADLSLGAIVRPNATNADGTLNMNAGLFYIFPNDVVNAKIKVHVFGPFGTTIWRAALACPDVNLAEPELVTKAKAFINSIK
jgi:hypothetical protein